MLKLCIFPVVMISVSSMFKYLSFTYKWQLGAWNFSALSPPLSREGRGLEMEERVDHAYRRQLPDKPPKEGVQRACRLVDTWGCRGRDVPSSAALPTSLSLSISSICVSICTLCHTL